MTQFSQLELKTHHINVWLWGLFKYCEHPGQENKNNHPNGILIKMMQDPFSQQDTEMEKASLNITFLTSNNWDQSTK